MKNWFYCMIAFALCLNSANAQTLKTYSGKFQGVKNYITQNLRYLGTAKQNGIQGRVIVRFVVSAEGKVKEAQVLRSLNPDCDKEAIRLVESMPNWVPGEQNGKAVNAYYTLPITFKLQ